MQYFTIFQDKFHSVNIQDVQYGRPVLTFDKRQICDLWSSVWMNINKITLQHNKEFIMFTFLFIGFITMCNLKKRLIGADLSTPVSDVHERLKTNSTAIKIARETTNMNNQ